MPKTPEIVHDIVDNQLAMDIILVAAQAAIFVAGTAGAVHRKSHENVELSPAVDNINRVILAPTGVKERFWQFIHTRGHHRFRDANVLEILRFADFLQYRVENSITEPPLHETYPNYDPIAELSVDDIQAIGDVQRAEIGHRYDRQAQYSQQEMDQFADNKTPKFFYPRRRTLLQCVQGVKKQRITHEPRSLDSLTSELRDPHSPALHLEGEIGIAKHNVPNYKDSQRDFMVQESEGRDFGKTKQDEFFEHTGVWMGLFFGSNVLLQIAIKRNLTKKGLAAAFINGSAVAGAALMGYVLGGIVTNVKGHSGWKDTLKNSIINVGRRSYGLPIKPPQIGEDGTYVDSGTKRYVDRLKQPQVKADGTFTSNNKWLSAPTFDEVGGQQNHHEKPWSIAYSDEGGIRKAVEAPFGTVLELLARHSLFLKPGTQFGHPEIKEINTPLLTPEDYDKRTYVRPDEPAKSVLMIEAIRRRTIQRRKKPKIE